MGMEKACEDAKNAVGGPTKLALALQAMGENITSQAVSQWRVVPADKALKVEAITGISCRDLRPDIFVLTPSKQPEATA